jgi:hypothetical protein
VRAAASGSSRLRRKATSTATTNCSSIRSRLSADHRSLCRRADANQCRRHDFCSMGPKFFPHPREGTLWGALPYAPRLNLSRTAEEGSPRLRRHARGCLEARYARLAATASRHKCKRPKIRFLRKVRMHRTGNSMSRDWGTSDDNVPRTAYRGRSEDHDKRVGHVWSDGLSVPRRLSRSTPQPN